MIRYYISSANLSAKKLAEAARQHWYIESVPQAHKSAA
jgi:predicted transposase YbfD/YdcC